MANDDTVTKRFIDTTTPPALPVVEALPEPQVAAAPPIDPSIPQMVTKTIKVIPMWQSLLHTFVTCIFSGLIAYTGGAYIQAKALMPALQTQTQKTQVLVAATQTKDQEIATLKAQIPQVATVEKLKKFYFLMKNPDGSLALHTGGSVSWRYNNPGKIAFGAWARAHGAIGQDGPMAIFPNIDVGMGALEALFFEPNSLFHNLSVNVAIEKFAQARDGYKYDDYIAFIVKNTKIKKTTLLSSMTTDDRTDFINAIKDYEHFIAGQASVYRDEKEFSSKGVK